MKLSGRQIQQIRDAILSGYPTRDELRAMVRIELEQELEAIAGGENQRVVIFNLVMWAERTGCVEALVRGAYRQTPGNPDLQLLAQEWWAQMPELHVSAPSPAVAAAKTGPISIDLFLSYSRKDANAMRQVQDVLRDAGLSVWTDEGLEPGTQSWQDAISDALNQAKAMVVLLSPNASASTWVKREISFAQSRGKSIFPVLIAGNEATAVPLSLIDAQRVDGRESLGNAVTIQLLPALGTRQDALPQTDGGPPAASQPPKAPTTGAGRSHRGVFLTATLALIVGVMGLYLVAHYLFVAQPPTQSPSSPNVYAPSPKPIVATEPAAGSVREIQSVPFVYVPAGEFKMGSDPAQDRNASDDETPQLTLTLPGYWIQRTEVTNEQYKRCVDAKACTPPSNARWNDAGYAAHPVSGVNWAQANAYATWFGGRLPTEAEWEKACRGTDGRIYPWGSQPPTVTLANYSRNIGDTKPIDSYPEGASPYGALNMAGNVGEWTSSLYQPYPYRADSGREDPNVGGPRSLRGGSWYNFGYGIRCAFRLDFNPVLSYSDIGFRVLFPGS